MRLIKRIDPRGCTCPDCLNHVSEPLAEDFNELQITRLIHGHAIDNTGGWMDQVEPAALAALVLQELREGQLLSRLRVQITFIRNGLPAETTLS